MDTKIKKLFTAGDGRIVSEHVVSVRKGTYVRLFSDGWDCDGKDLIDVWMIPYVPASECEDAIAVPYLERCVIDCCTTVDLPKARLTKDRTFDIIRDIGSFVFRRKCGAEDVNVYVQYQKE